MEENKTNSGSQQVETMPVPKTNDYDVKYKINDVFISDMRRVLKDMEYMKVEPFLKFAISRKDGLYSAELYEFINKLKYLPYIHIYRLIDSINYPDSFKAYFTELPKPKENEA